MASSESSPDQDLPFTGERFTPECVREIRYEHVHRYAFAQRLVEGQRVLDAACGEGYGSAMLAARAASVSGVDLSAEAVAHARRRYRAPGLSFEQADCLALPFADDSFDRVVSFETLEHLEDHNGLLREFRRVLRADGLLLISSPDKAVYSDQQQNRNPFHVRELYRPEFEALLSAHFPAYQLWGQRLLFQSAIWRLDVRRPEALPATFAQERGETIQHAPEPAQDPVYFIALCAAAPDHLPDPDWALSLFDDAGQSVYEHYYHEIRKNMAAGELLADRERELQALRAELQRTAEASGPGLRRPWWRRLLGRG
jgi:SAM-dependent methyltransferase